jgi:hypothetical protein
MIVLRRASERYHVRHRRRDVKLTFYHQDHADPLAGDFGSLDVFGEVEVPPGVDVWPAFRPEAEVVTYVLSGSLEQKDSTGLVSVVRAGEFHRMIARDGVRHCATRAARAKPAHVFQARLRPTVAKHEPGHAQRRFTAAERRDELCVVASPDGRNGSLRLDEDAVIYSAILDAGRHVVHELPPQRSSWLHVVSGTARLADCVLEAGDGAGIVAEHAVSLTAREKTEILLLDLRTQRPKYANDGGVP